MIISKENFQVFKDAVYASGRMEEMRRLVQVLMMIEGGPDTADEKYWGMMEEDIFYTMRHYQYLEGNWTFRMLSEAWVSNAIYFLCRLHMENPPERKWMKKRTKEQLLDDALSCAKQALRYYDKTGRLMDEENKTKPLD